MAMAPIIPEGKKHLIQYSEIARTARILREAITGLRTRMEQYAKERKLGDISGATLEDLLLLADEWGRVRED